MSVPRSSPVPPPSIAVIGGGITGLSTAYYLHERFGDAVSVVVFERANLVGGLIAPATPRKARGGNEKKSAPHNALVLEKGARSLRVTTPEAKVTLAMAARLGLATTAMITASPAALRRHVYDGPGRGVVTLPHSTASLVSFLWSQVG